VFEIIYNVSKCMVMLKSTDGPRQTCKYCLRAGEYWIQGQIVDSNDLQSTIQGARVNRKGSQQSSSSGTARDWVEVGGILRICCCTDGRTTECNRFTNIVETDLTGA